MSEPFIEFLAETGLQRHLGYVARVYEDRSEVEMEVKDIHLNRRERLHGGVYATLLDAACGYAASRQVSEDAGALFVTLSLTTEYLAPGHKGKVKAIGRVTGGGRDTLFTRGEIRDARDRLIGTCSATYKRLRQVRSDRKGGENA